MLGPYKLEHFVEKKSTRLDILSIRSSRHLILIGIMSHKPEDQDQE